jgi:hypothetical protein
MSPAPTLVHYGKQAVNPLTGLPDLAIPRPVGAAVFGAGECPMTEADGGVPQW